MIINNKKIQEKVFSSGGSKQKILEAAEIKIRRKVNLAKKILLQKVREHIVSKELKGGALANNDSGTLGGYGNLFSFIGFSANSNPVDDLISFLDEGIDIIKNPNITRAGKINFSIGIPTKSDFDAALSLPWEYGRSWPHAIENGIGNLGHFLSRLNEGRSLGGIQVKNELSNRSFSPIDFITPILKEFEVQIRS